jgi:hypothetical protein
VKRLTLITLLLALAPACFVDPYPDDKLVPVSLSLGLASGSSILGANPTNSPFDQQDLFHLESFPKFVRVGVELDDYELTSGSWPDPDKGVGQGESASGEVQVELLVPAGPGRTVKALGYLLEQGQVKVYRQASTKTLDLAAGRTTDLSIYLVLHDAGTLDVSVRCQQGNSGKWQPQQISIVDARAQVVFPAVNLSLDPFTYALSAEIPGVPTGRPFWVRVFLKQSSSSGGQIKFLDQRIPTFEVSSPNATTPVNLSIPCHILP